jgi:diguanylate cyclase (GGDEF)-like protein
MRHEAGDKVLRSIARVLRDSTQPDDLAARYEGEEFVLMRKSELEDTSEVPDRICQAVKRECSAERDASLSR